MIPIQPLNLLTPLGPAAIPSQALLDDIDQLVPSNPTVGSTDLLDGGSTGLLFANPPQRQQPFQQSHTSPVLQQQSNGNEMFRHSEFTESHTVDETHVPAPESQALL